MAPELPSGEARPSTARTPFTLREVRWEDFEPLVSTYFELYDERDRGDPIGISLFAERPSRDDEVTWFAGLLRRTHSGETVAVIADVGGRAVGSCTVGPAGPLRASETGHVGVLGILVNQRFRGQGIGESLMVRTLEQCRGKFELVRLSVFADNVGAKRLYERLDFQKCGNIPRAIKRAGQYVDEELMVRDLAVPLPSGGPANR
jgi:RimJ/RimL family protein N-acetyltransferase